jgi:hypothetical protein
LSSHVPIAYDPHFSLRQLFFIILKAFIAWSGRLCLFSLPMKIIVRVGSFRGTADNGTATDPPGITKIFLKPSALKSCFEDWETVTTVICL